MKPSQLADIGARNRRTGRRYPITDCNYRPVGFRDFTARCTGTPRSSFAEISRDYFNSEARRSLVLEVVLFAVISVTVAPAILDCARALLEFIRAIGAS